MSDTPLTDAAAILDHFFPRPEVGLAEAKERIKELEADRDRVVVEIVRDLRDVVCRLRFLQSASAETLSAMPDWSDESIDAELAKEGGSL
jgi:hypothetical protein